MCVYACVRKHGCKYILGVCVEEGEWGKWNERDGMGKETVTELRWKNFFPFAQLQKNENVPLNWRWL